ncbi:phosphatase 2C (PP2C)-like protein [Corchorus capsularis]|uniref:protein-serine/threonine phosphatase n=1 Tax=Corchorus capsularis TaxID=210143 RepID=A0A1R3ITM0_COCAP|nr:phosphatase 2C (PP2C)-like protein [Corchorus capsularis]
MAPQPAELLLNALSDDSENETPEKCRERRRRRIQLRRLKYVTSTIHRYASLLRKTSNETWAPLITTRAATTEMGVNPMPVNGWISIQGFSDSMDDRVVVKEEFCRSDVFGGYPLHFFAVYDGHGGPHVSSLCKQMMHKIMAEELARLSIQKAPETSDAGSGEWGDLVRVALEKSFSRMDEVALSTCACGKFGYLCGCKPMELGFAGSTAVVAILTPHHVVVANCGDSRAVLCRAGKPIPLSLDHKPERPDEQERIQAAGGKLVYQNGVRVYGILNMSRALGDNILKKVITSKPEISITERHLEDECLILATDGLWDVMSDALACEVASTCLRDGSSATATRSCYSDCADKTDGGETLFPSKSAFAAAILCRLALGRGSCDNISVIVVDLKKHSGIY